MRARCETPQIQVQSANTCSCRSRDADWQPAMDVDEHGMAGVHRAASQGLLDECAGLLRSDPSLVECRDSVGNTPLHWAVVNPDLVAVVVGTNADVNARNRKGDTPLMKAVARDRPRSVSVLADHGADVSLQNALGRTALMMAAELGNLEIVRCLLGHGADPRVQDASGWTALHFASLGAWPQYESHRGAMKALLASGADVNAVEKTCGWTPIHVATDASAVRILAGAGADINRADRDGRAPVHYLNADGVAELHTLNARLDAVDRFHRTALHLCASPEKAIILIALCPNDINRPDAQGKTPLDWALTRPEVARVIRERGGQTSNNVSRCSIM
ncbi:Ankyrin repeat domain-containing protein [Plasmodiophora brassicae]